MADLSEDLQLSSENNDTMALSGAALLLVVGEPFSQDHRESLLQNITSGKA